MNIEKLPSQRFRISSVCFWTLEGCSASYEIEFDENTILEMKPSREEASLVALPLGFDVQAHLRVPGQKEKEDAETGLRAALVGGYAGLLSMPNTKPVIDSVEVLRLAQAEVRGAEEKWGVRAFFTGALSKNLEGQALVDFQALSGAGVLAFTDDGLGLERDELMREAYKQLEPLGKPLLQHSEMPGHGGVLAPGPVQEKVGVKAYSDDPEIEMLERDLRLLKEYPQARYHLLHTTSRRAIPLIRQAKKEGLNVTAEVSPHHLFFSTEDIREENTSFKMNPPIRSPQDRQKLQEALFEGDFDFVATDHAPHASEQKTDHFDSAAFGTIGLETTLPVLIHFYQKKQLNPKRFVEVFSARPQEFLGIDIAPLRFEKGSPARFCLIRPSSEPVEFTEKEIASKSKNSCFLGAKLPQGPLASLTDAGFFQFQPIKELAG